MEQEISMYDFYKEKYYEHKKDNKKVMLVIQCGDFYEVYDKYLGDGKYELGVIEIFSKITNYRIKRKGNNIAMSGCPLYVDLDKFKELFHNEGYIFIDYIQDEKNSIRGKKKLRILNNISTPGTSINFNDMYYHEKTNNLMIVWLTYRKGNINMQPILAYGLSNINIITGDCNVHESIIKNYKFGQIHNYDDIETFYSIFNPNELIFIHNFDDDKEINIIKTSCVMNSYTKIINSNDNECIKKLNGVNLYTYSETIMNNFYKFKDFNDFLDINDLYDHEITLKALVFNLNYIKTYNSNINTIKLPIFKNVNKYIKLRNSVLKQLNIIENKDKYYHKSNFNSLINLINKCKTPMGKRKLKNMLLMPVKDICYLNREYNILEHFINNIDKHSAIINKLNKIRDIDYIYRKFNEDKFLPYDLLNLFNTINVINDIHNFYKNDEIINKYLMDINNINDNNLTNIQNNINFLINEMDKHIDFKVILDYNNNDIYNTNFFKQNELTEPVFIIENKRNNYIHKLNEIKDYLSKCIDSQMIKDKGKTDKHVNIKIYKPEKTHLFLKLTASKGKLLKKYLKNSKVIIDKNYEIKNKGKDGYMIESNILNKLYIQLDLIENTFKKKCKLIFHEIINTYKQYNNELSNLSEYISIIDTLMTKAIICKKYNYCKPIINEDNDKAFLNVIDLRHPLVEHLLTDEVFTPNNVCLGKDNNDTILIYGVNAVGKSVLMKSIGLCIFLAQTGMFVPATDMHYKPYTQIFTRILGNDNMFKGQSTFIVEMNELCTIINNSDENSLILGDELCSGTESISALTLFLGTLDIISKTKSSCIFTTHYHQLYKLLNHDQYDNIKFKHMSVLFDNEQDVIIYNRKLKDGMGPNCYGLEVCKGIGFNNEFMDKCFEIKNNIFDNTNILDEDTSKYNRQLVKHLLCEICNNNNADEIHHLNPQKNANDDGFIGSYHKHHVANLINICKPCHEHITKHDIVYKKIKTNKGYVLIKQ